MRRQKSSFSKVISLFFVALIIGAGVFVYFSPQFEKRNPQISFENSGFWNLKDKLRVTLFDESGIKSYKVLVESSGIKTEVTSKDINTKETTLAFEIDSIPVNQNVQQLKLIIEAYDNSMWNFFRGNTSKKEFILKIDKKRPDAVVIANSYNIKRGGSAAVVVKVSDNNLKEKYITFNKNTRFELIPFMKKDYYAAIIAWPVDIKFDDFDVVNLVAVDKANNVTIKKIPLYIKDLEVKRDKINISDNFVEKVSIPVLQKSDKSVPASNKEIFVKQNHELRADNVKKIRDESVKNMSKEMIKSFSVKPFKRLKGSKTFAGFAERREYFYNREKIDEAWHLGNDWASIKHAKIKVSNPGDVIFSGYLGIYGNVLIIDHQLGLQSLYAHTSRFKVNKGDSVSANQLIANTGSTGAVFGDHLHFGMLVQGIEVNPLEWMDKNWIKSRILNVLAEAKQEIRSSK